MQVAKKSFIKIHGRSIEAYAMILTVCLHFGLDAKCCSVAWKYLKIMRAANAASCMTSMLHVVNAAGCTQHAPNNLYETTKISTGIICL